MLYVHDQVLRLCPTSYSLVHEFRIFMYSLLSDRANFAKWTFPLPFLPTSDTKFVGQSVEPPPPPSTNIQNKQLILEAISETIHKFPDPWHFYKELPLSWTMGWIKSSSFTSDTSRKIKCETTQWNTAKLKQPRPNSPVPMHWHRACEKVVNKNCILFEWNCTPVKILFREKTERVFCAPMIHEHSSTLQVLLSTFWHPSSKLPELVMPLKRCSLSLHTCWLKLPSKVLHYQCLRPKNLK